MIATTCKHCQALKKGYLISRPKDLTKLILILQESMHFLDEINPFTLSLITEKITTLPAKGPWEESIYHILKCKSCGLIYELSCNTYNGRCSFEEATEKILAQYKQEQERLIAKKNSMKEDAKRAYSEAQKWRTLLDDDKDNE